jgi:GxxExxY protein
MIQTLSGKVVRGKSKGRTLGFPTANIKIPEDLEIISGVYAGWVEINSQKYPAGIFVSPDGKNLEAHILNFSEDIYGKNIVVELKNKIRDIIKFNNDEELKNQITKDINKITREYRANEKRIDANAEKDLLVYPELSYKIVGLAMEVHNKLGNIYQEKHYQKVFEEKLKRIPIEYEKEKQITVRTDDDCEIGEFFTDFIIEDKILLEFKYKNFIHYGDIKQVLRYLDATGLKLGIILNFKLNKLQYRRVINPRVSNY